MKSSTAYELSGWALLIMAFIAYITNTINTTQALIVLALSSIAWVHASIKRQNES